VESLQQIELKTEKKRST